ncbi:MAG: site-specific integrase [Candidatus Solibacter sp.]
MNLYRRHFRLKKKCVGDHKPDSFSYEYDEMRRGWTPCSCPIYASGRVAGKFGRKNTEQVRWPEAKGVALLWEKAAAWDTLPPQPLFAPAPQADPNRVTINYAVNQYMDEHQRGGSARATISAYAERSNALRRFCTLKGYVMLDQLAARDVREYRATWDNGPRTRANKLNWLRIFFNYCVAQQWLDVSPAASVTNRGIGKARVAVNVQKSPFTDAELSRIFAACQKLPSHSWFNGWGKGEWSGRDLEDFIAVLAYTGLRISDVVQFDTARLKGNLCFLRQHKTGKPLFTWLPDWLRDRLQVRTAKHGTHIFNQFTFKTTDVRTMTQVWRNKIRMAFDIASKDVEFPKPPTPHRFRHTFVRVLLQHGVDIEDVAELSGDTPEVIRLHYAEWCPERQDRLTRVLQEAFAGKPTPGLLVIEGGRDKSA